jgi:hypothetical protein
MNKKGQFTTVSSKAGKKGKPKPVNHATDNVTKKDLLPFNYKSEKCKFNTDCKSPSCNFVHEGEKQRVGVCYYGYIGNCTYNNCQLRHIKRCKANPEYYNVEDHSERIGSPYEGKCPYEGELECKLTDCSFIHSKDQGYDEPDFESDDEEDVIVTKEQVESQNGVGYLKALVGKDAKVDDEIKNAQLSPQQQPLLKMLEEKVSRPTTPQKIVELAPVGLNKVEEYITASMDQHPAEKVQQAIKCNSYVIQVLKFEALAVLEEAKKMIANDTISPHVQDIQGFLAKYLDNNSGYYRIGI